MTIQTNGDDCRESGAGETSRRAFEDWAINQCRFDLRYSDPVRKTYASMKTRQAWVVWQASRAASEPVSQAYKLPELNDELINILGRPNFTCTGIANILRKGGVTINRKSEHEQAAVIHFLLGHYIQSGDGWIEAAENALHEISRSNHEQRNPPQT